MRKIKAFISYTLAVILCLSINSTVRVSAEDTSWKPILADFLIENFPSLFNEATIKKNEEMFREWLEYEWEKESGEGNKYIPNYADIPVDAIGEWDSNAPYFPVLLPSRYSFYDLDNNGISEVVISYPSYWAEGHDDYVYALKNEKYEKVYSNLSVDFYLNTQNKLVVAEGYYTSLKAIYFGEMVDGNLILSDYIDSKGNDTYNGFKYNYLGGEGSYVGLDGGIYNYQLGEDYIILDEIIKDDSLVPLSQFDCSDIIDSIKVVSVAPQTGDSNTIIFLITAIISFGIIILIRRKKYIYR